MSGSTAGHPCTTTVLAAGGRAGHHRRQELLQPRLRSCPGRGGLVLLRPSRKGEPERPGACFFKPLRQIIESVNDTFKGQLDLERHGGHTTPSVTARCCNASSPSQPRAGMTTAPASPSCAPFCPTITDPLESRLVGQRLWLHHLWLAGPGCLIGAGGLRGLEPVTCPVSGVSVDRTCFRIFILNYEIPFTEAHSVCRRRRRSFSVGLLGRP